MTKTSLKNQPGHSGPLSFPGFLHDLQLGVGACGQRAHSSPSQLKKQVGKHTGAVPVSCPTLGWEAQWSGFLCFPKFGCYRSDTNCPKPGQDGRDAAVLQGDEGWALLLAWG